MTTKAALQGKTLRGKIDFAAATSGELLLDNLGAWTADNDGYQVAVSILRRQFWNVLVAVVADSTDYTINANGQGYTITSGIGATATTIRDQLIAKVDAGLPANGVDAAIVDASNLSLLGTRGGDDLAVTVSANLTATFAMEALPNFGVFKEDGKVVVRTAAAFTGSFDVIAQA